MWILDWFVCAGLKVLYIPVSFGGCKYGGSRWIIRILKWLCPKAYGPVIFYLEDEEDMDACLSLDDGPGDVEEMHKILDALKETDQRATFFIISSLITKEREVILKRMVEEGHELGNHMVVDEATTKYSSAKFEQCLLECETALNRFKKEDARTIKWYRPPCGKITASQVDILQKHHYQIALGDVYPLDVAISKHCDRSHVVNCVLKNVQSGSVAILHCPDSGNGRKHFTQQILDVIIKNKNRKFVTLSELVHHQQQQQQ